MVRQTIRNIDTFGLKKVTKKKPTAYWDLSGKKQSQRKRHKDMLKKILEDRMAKISDLTDFLDCIGLVLGEIPILKKEKTCQNVSSVEEISSSNDYCYFKKKYLPKRNSKEISSQIANKNQDQKEKCLSLISN
jgi:hypothetical protein